VNVNAPSPFDLDLTVRSHGFYDLAPWSYDPERRLLSRPLLLAAGQAVVADVAPRDAAAGERLALRVTAEGRLSAAERREARAQIRRCLALDEDLGPFYARVRELEAAPPARRPLPQLAWAVERGAGRLLRSPTVFEDAVKTLCTTNCTWALTRVMVRNLVERLGVPAPPGGHTFPTAAAMAERPERFFREAIRAGYRAGAMRTIAREVASGALDMERWRDPALATDGLAEQIGELPGFGPYATGHLLRLLGRYDHLALDSWTRGKLARLRGTRRPPSDRAMRRWYAPYGRFAGLAMWLEVTADWHGPAPTWPPPE
jgi:3-methyladenine DNA glycosylase/8-oxoguanine DNA glycosylase